ncbi:MAG TPA: hypothetical protein VF609_02390 [Flavisolibacter sp.]|jgi:hypothetical protein
MKRLVLIAGIAFSVLSCAQHDSKSPDTSGVDPQNPNQVAPADTMANANGQNNNRNGGSSGGNNMNNDGTNNNQTVTTGDSSLNQKNQ